MKVYYEGTIYTVQGRFYLGKCEFCGYVSSTENFIIVPYHDDADISCPKCNKICLCEEVGIEMRGSVFHPKEIEMRHAQGVTLFVCDNYNDARDLFQYQEARLVLCVDGKRCMYVTSANDAAAFYNSMESFLRNSEVT